MLSSVNSNNNNSNGNQYNYITPDYLSPTTASVSCQSSNKYIYSQQSVEIYANKHAHSRVVAINYDFHMFHKFLILLFDTPDSHFTFSCHADLTSRSLPSSERQIFSQFRVRNFNLNQPSSLAH